MRAKPSLNLRRLMPRRQEHSLYWLTEGLAFTNEPNANAWANIHDAGIRAALDMRAEVDSQLAVEAAGLRYLRIPVVDGQAPSDQMLRLATDWISERIANSGPVLVFCRQGRSRSATVATAMLIKMGFSLTDATARVNRARADVYFTDAQVTALDQFAAAHSPGLTPVATI